ncbi:MAG: hypothetical protein ACK5C3_03330, partial [bacterium]
AGDDGVEAGCAEGKPLDRQRDIRRRPRRTDRRAEAVCAQRRDEFARAGITAAKAAGMRCIALTSKGHTVERQREADLVFPDVKTVTVAAVRALLQ